jgi:phytoene synthase
MNPVSSPSISLAESYRHCGRVTRREARNFYYSFLVLPPDRRAALCAVYAFMRYSDDISDDAEEGTGRAGRMRAWRAALDAAFAGDCGASPILPAFHDTAARYRIPPRYFHELIDGVEMDLTPRRYGTFSELYRYCYHVASVVGLVCIHIFGFSDPGAFAYAEACGIAFQLTNILRDLGEDSQRGRVYLPQDELRQFQYADADLQAQVVNDRFRELMRFQVARARDYYRKAEPLLPLVDPVSRPCLQTMILIYRAILDQIVRQKYDVFSNRARVPAWNKLGIAARAWLQTRRPPRREPLNAS